MLDYIFNNKKKYFYLKTYCKIKKKLFSEKIDIEANMKSNDYYYAREVDSSPDIVLVFRRNL